MENRNWKEEIESAKETPHKFHHLADSYMNVTGRSDNAYRKEEFNKKLFEAMLQGIPTFEHIWRVITILHGGSSKVTRPSLFDPMLFRRALELAGNDDAALRTIVGHFRCPSKILQRAEKRLTVVTAVED